MNEEGCWKCAYFSGKPSNDPRWKWRSCKRGIQNLTEESYKRCKHYVKTLEGAYEQELAAFNEKFRDKFDLPEMRCAFCYFRENK